MHNLVCRLKHQTQHYYDSMRKKQKEQRIQASYALLITLVITIQNYIFNPVGLPEIEPKLNSHAKSIDMKALAQPHPSPQHSNILQNVGMLWYNVEV